MKRMLRVVWIIPLLSLSFAVLKHVEITAGMSFSPSTLTVSVGDSVLWTNNHSTTHTATSTDTPEAWEDDNISPGATFQVTFNNAGVFPYDCAYHPSMTGTITVGDISGCADNAELDECGVCGGDGIADGACDCDGNVTDCAGECGGSAENCPDWEDNPGAYEFVATMTAAVTDLGVQLHDTNDILAAFDNEGNVRSLDFVLEVPFPFPNEGDIVHQLTLRSNAAGDHLTFKFYDASEDAILDITEDYVFVINDIIGLAIYLATTSFIYSFV